MKLDLGCGCRLNPGHVGVDYLPLKTLFPGLAPPHYGGENYIQHDLFQFPWPIKNDSVEDAILRHFVDFIPHRLPRQEGDPLASKLDGFYLFFEELYRVMKPYGKVTVVYHNTEIGDPSMTRRVNQFTWAYLSKDWRDDSIYEDPNCDFHLESITNTGTDSVVVLSTVKVV